MFKLRLVGGPLADPRTGPDHQRRAAGDEGKNLVLCALVPSKMWSNLQPTLLL
jgi:hypothetical protein